jgi:hypothetical protein
MRGESNCGGSSAGLRPSYVSWPDLMIIGAKRVSKKGRNRTGEKCG